MQQCAYETKEWTKDEARRALHGRGYLFPCETGYASNDIMRQKLTLFGLGNRACSLALLLIGTAEAHGGT